MLSSKWEGYIILPSQNVQELSWKNGWKYHWKPEVVGIYSEAVLGRYDRPIAHMHRQWPWQHTQTWSKSSQTKLQHGQDRDSCSPTQSWKAIVNWCCWGRSVSFLQGWDSLEVTCALMDNTQWISWVKIKEPMELGRKKWKLNYGKELERKDWEVDLIKTHYICIWSPQ